MLAVFLAVLQIPTKRTSIQGPKVEDPVVRVFASGEKPTTFGQLSVSLRRFVMVGAGGDRTVFVAKPGRTLDVGAFTGPAGRRFQFVARKRIPSGVYNGFRLEVDEALSLGASTATFTDSRFHFRSFVVEFPAPRRIERQTDITVDFDTSHWKLKGAVIDAPAGSVSLLDARGVDIGVGQVAESFVGVVTGPIGKSTLIGVRQDGWVLPVRFGASAPKKGDRIEVNGVFSTSEDAFIASTFRIDAGKP
jgi:hypothetical protein